MANKIYQSLVVERKEVRLAVLRPANSYTADIHCDLQVVSLCDDPQYYAISYVWGDGKKLRPINLNGILWQVTENLESALRHLRALRRYTCLWIDAICINQSCSAERGYQVSIMGSIYAGAIEVLVWFGTNPGGLQTLDTTDMTGTVVVMYEEAPGFNDRRAALDRYLDQADTPPRDTVYLLSVHQAVFPFLVSDLLSLLADERVHLHELPIFETNQLPFINVTGEGRKVLRGLEAFIENPWWRRIWVVQEVLLSNEARIIWGPISIPWSTVTNAAANFVSHHGSCCRGLAAYMAADDWAIFVKYRTLVQDIEYQRVQLSEEGFQLTTLLGVFGSRLSTDPRDKIYGLLGLVTDWDVSRTPRITADYNQTISTVYQSAVLSIIFDTLVAEILVLSGGERALPGLPSWVPNLSSVSVPNHYLDNFWQQCRLSILQLYTAWTGPGIDPFWKDPVLCMVGCYVDIVRETGETMTSSTYNIEQATVTILEQWQRILDLPVQSDKQYVTNKCTMFEAFWRTMFGDVMFASDDIKATSGHRPRNIEAYRRAVSEDEPAWIWLWQWFKLLSTSPRRRKGEHPPDDPPSPRPGMKLIELDLLFRINCMNRKLFTTVNGYIGLGPPQTQIGDVVFILFGSRVPLVLRRHEDQSPITFSPDGFGQKHILREITLTKTSYSVIGDCFIHGVMDGEFNKINEKGEVIFLR